MSGAELRVSDEHEAGGGSDAASSLNRRPLTLPEEDLTLRTVAHFPHYIGRPGSLILRPKFSLRLRVNGVLPTAGEG